MCTTVVKLLLEFGLSHYKDPLAITVLTTVDSLMPACKQMEDGVKLRNVLGDAVQAHTTVFHHRTSHQTDGAYDQTLAYGNACELDNLLAAKCSITSSCGKITALDDTSEAARTCTAHVKFQGMSLALVQHIS